MHVSVWAYMSVCVDTRSVQDAGDIFLLVFFIAKGQDLSLNQNLAVWTTGWPVSSWGLLCLYLNARVTGTCSHTLFLTCMLEI